MICPNCSNEIGADAFCPKCGAQQEVHSVQEKPQYPPPQNNQQAVPLYPPPSNTPALQPSKTKGAWENLPKAAKILIIVVAVIFFLGLVNTCTSGGSTSTQETQEQTSSSNQLSKEEQKAKEEEQKAKEEEEQRTQAAEMESKLNSLKGQSFAVAYNDLTALGYAVTFIHSTSKMDFTQEVQLDIANPDSEFYTPWVIVDYESLDTTVKTVALLINTQENLDNEAAANAMQQALTEKLDVYYAWAAAESYGKSLYPYGFKLHYIVGKLAETPEDENTWFLKATCDVTNAYGAKMKNVVCEAKVTGTSDNPEIVYFIVY
ncbi:MAG: zinc ribbon domain-containing protein [Eggerthellaceae bacterium]|nr:zinc ribbon domain-containing protein [Eggerthellaceae bacterium]